MNTAITLTVDYNRVSVNHNSTHFDFPFPIGKKLREYLETSSSKDSPLVNWIIAEQEAKDI